MKLFKKEIKELLDTEQKILNLVQTEDLAASKDKALKYCLYQIMRIQPSILVTDDGIVSARKLASLYHNRLSVSYKACGTDGYKIMNDVECWAKAIDAIVKIGG